MRQTYLFLLIVLILAACGQEKGKGQVRELANDLKLDKSFWVPLSENDSVKYISSKKRVFNQGKDSIMLIYYATDLYKTNKDVANPNLKKQALKLVNLLSQRVKLPDTIYLRAVGNKSNILVEKKTDVNIIAGNNSGEWKIKDGEVWKSFEDFHKLPE